MNTEEMYDAIDSFIGGFGTRETEDSQNALFIAKKLFNLDLPLEFRGMGRVGVECLDLYFPLEDAKPSQKNPEAFNAGKILSNVPTLEKNCKKISGLRYFLCPTQHLALIKY